jgi:hypothetical protein
MTGSVVGCQIRWGLTRRLGGGQRSRLLANMASRPEAKEDHKKFWCRSECKKGISPDYQ